MLLGEALTERLTRERKQHGQTEAAQLLPWYWLWGIWVEGSGR